MKKLLKDPLIHFLLIGLLLFILYSLVNDASESRDNIVIDTNDINSAIEKWRLQWKRPPTKEELAGLLTQNMQQEVFYQEALKMNLDHNDEIIKRRLSQKMEFLSNDLANMKEPTEAELKNYFEKHSDKYMLPFTFSLYQIVFTNEKHTNPNAVIAAILAEKDNLSIDNMNTKGDNLPFPYVMKNITGTELASQLGSEFAKALQTIELNTWVGPVQSGFGKHIVYISDREVPTLPLFEAARAEVLRDYQYDRQNELNKAIYDELRKNYNITITIEDGNFDPEIKTYLENQLKK